MMKYRDTACCGVKELHGLSSYRTSEMALKALCQERYGWLLHNDVLTRKRLKFPAAHMFFTGVSNKRSMYGERFAAYLRENNLGEVIETEAIRNPNSGNRLKMWVWTINHRNLEAWWKANK